MDAPYTSPIKEKVVFLTFDDGPNTVNSPKVLDILSQAGVHGTFSSLASRLVQRQRRFLRRNMMLGMQLDYIA